MNKKNAYTYLCRCRRPVSVSELAEKLNMKESTTKKLLQNLSVTGFAKSLGKGFYEAVLVRDIILRQARNFSTFKATDIELGLLSFSGVRHVLPKLVESGDLVAIQSHKNGTWVYKVATRLEESVESCMDFLERQRIDIFLEHWKTVLGEPKQTRW